MHQGARLRMQWLRQFLSSSGGFGLWARVRSRSLNDQRTGCGPRSLFTRAIGPLLIPPGAEARALLHHVLENGDIVGRDTTGRTIIQLAVDDWALDRLLTFDAEAVELEDEGDDEPDADDEEDGAPVLLGLVRPKRVERRRCWGRRLPRSRGDGT